MKEPTYQPSAAEKEAFEKKKALSNQGFPVSFDPWEAELLGCVHEDAIDDEDEDGNPIEPGSVILPE
jgi:hypothetical protein